MVGSILALDLGGSHASTALIQCESPRKVSGFSFTNLDHSAPAEELLDRLRLLGMATIAATGIAPEKISGISIGVPNPFDYDSGISYMRHKYAGFYGMDMRSAIAKQFNMASETITFVNDASAFLLGELASGIATDSKRTIGITLGTGIGSAFAIEGNIVMEGPNVPSGGFIWDLPYQGMMVEDFISSRAIQERYRRITSQRLEVKEIAARAMHDPHAADTFRQFGITLGRVLHSICGSFDPDMIVLGGGIARSARWFLPAAQLQLADSRIRLRVSGLLDHATLLGAANWWRRTAARAGTA